MEKSKISTVKRILILGMMFLLSGGIACAGSLLYQPETESLIRNVVMALAGTGIVIYAYLFSETAGLFIYRNEGKYDKFAVVYLGSMIAAIFFPWLPVTGWPFLVIFVLLGVFSNGITGMMAGSVCLLLAVNFAGGDLSVFWLYFISGLAGILMFSNLNDDFLVGLPVGTDPVSDCERGSFFQGAACCGTVYHSGNEHDDLLYFTAGDLKGFQFVRHS